ncbi:MAG TPA: BTAD domain-containing putative transcriptional regulator, partial [Nocardioides sp.]|uniref:AfsR/SARP family transcriptional regulator n=1 Tax=Nocardioides sp. TaxID=35761 RepID=UPI002CD2FF3F
AARVRVRLGWVEGSDAAARSRAREAARTLERLGVVRLEGRPLTALASEPRVRIEVLGGFTVTVDGAPVPVTAWRSRQARTLVKLLAARRGRPLTRSAVCELLWPDDDPARTGHRLSVLLTTVRGVLDPDRRRAPEHHVASDQSGLWLDLRHVALDAEDLVRESGQAAELLEEGDLTRAREVLVHLDRTYRGAAFEDEPYEPWADALREEARAAWIGSARRLVSLPPDARRPVDVQALLVRLLAEDPYDEQAHRLRVRSLVRAGRYGEARRAFARWTEAMREIEAPVPDPDLLHPTTPRPARPVASGR